MDSYQNKIKMSLLAVISIIVTQLKNNLFSSRYIFR